MHYLRILLHSRRTLGHYRGSPGLYRWTLGHHRLAPGHYRRTLGHYRLSGILSGTIGGTDDSSSGTIGGLSGTIGGPLGTIGGLSGTIGGLSRYSRRCPLSCRESHPRVHPEPGDLASRLPLILRAPLGSGSGLSRILSATGALQLLPTLYANAVFWIPSHFAVRKVSNSLPLLRNPMAEAGDPRHVLFTNTLLERQHVSPVISLVTC